MPRIIVIPAILIGCLIVIWIGTVAAVNMPPQESLGPTLTAIAESENAGTFEEQTHQQLTSTHHTEQECRLSASYDEMIQQWCPIIQEASIQSGIPCDLIAAVILQESGGDPLSYSSSGAVGLMQVMPRDGLAVNLMCINGPCFASRPTIEELQDPAFNVHYGSQMLAALYAQHGSYREALFRYGPMNIGYHYADLVLKIWENYQ